MVFYCDSDYSGDKDTRISVTGYIIFLMGAVVCYKSKAQRGVTLSSTEAEYYAISEVCKEILYIKQLLEFLNKEVKTPIIVQVDNVGAIQLANKSTGSQRTRHIDIRTHFVREYVEDGTVKIIFVRSKDNLADGFTKKVSGEIFEQHTRKYMKKE